jgi:hypothetical protein
MERFVYGLMIQRERVGSMPEERRSESSQTPGVAGWTALAILGACLGGAVWFAFYGWTLVDGTDISEAGMIALLLGVVFSMALGAGLMALLFWSHRQGFDR